MTMQEQFAYIEKLLNDIGLSNESTNYYKVQCGRAKKRLAEIKQKLHEDENFIGALKRETENTPKGEMSCVTDGSKTSTFILNADQHNHRSAQNNVTGQEKDVHKKEETKIIAYAHDTEPIQENATLRTEAADQKQGEKDQSTKIADIKPIRGNETLKTEAADLKKGNKDQLAKSDGKQGTDLIQENEKLKNKVEDLEKKFQELSTNAAAAKARLEEKLRKEQEENILKIRQIDELRNRLSAFAAHQLTKDNPQIADLSDSCRPTKLAEGFSQLYDNQWTDAFASFDKKRKEREIIDILSGTIQQADRFCEKENTQMTERILLYVADEINNPKINTNDRPVSATFKAAQKESKQARKFDMTATKLAAERYIKDLMKALATESSQPIAKIFLQGPMQAFKREYKIKENTTQIDTYAEEAVKLVWMMKVQQPPVELFWVDPGSRCVKETFKFYTKKGDIVAQCIWPAVLLHKDGPVLVRGVV